MIKKILIVATLSLLFLLVACRNEMPGDSDPVSGADTTTPASSMQPTTRAEEGSNDEAIQLRLLVSEHRTAAYRSLASRFEEENPDIQVELVTQSQLLNAKEGTTFAPEEYPRRKAEGADVITTGTGRLDVSQGLRLDLTPFIEADGTFDENDFYPGLLDRYRWDGGIWALPASATFELIVFNKDLFDEAGYPYPEPGWSWADFLDTALALTKRDQTNQVTQWGYVDWTIGQALFPKSVTGPLLDASVTPPQSRLDHPQFISGVKWYSDLFLVHQVAPLPRTQEELDSFLTQADTLIKQDQAAMWKRDVLFLLTSNQEDNLGFVPLPEGTEVGTGSMAISAGTRHPAAAWRLLSFLNQQMRRDITGAPTGVPARRSVAAASGFYEEIDEELATAIEYALAHALPPSNEFGVGPVTSAFMEALRQILVGRLSVAEALAQAQVQAEAGLADALLAQENVTLAPPLAVAPADTPPAERENRTTITFAPLGEPFNWQAYRDLAQQFTEANPGLVVEIEPSSPYAAPTTFAGVAANTDCFEWSSSINRGTTETAVLSLEPFFDADPVLAPADFFDAALAQFTAQEQLLGLPATINTAVIAYNRDLFEEAGLAPPASDWTIDDFRETAVALTQGAGEDKQYGYIPHHFETLDFINMASWLGAPLLDDGQQPPAPVSPIRPPWPLCAGTRI